MDKTEFAILCSLALPVGMAVFFAIGIYGGIKAEHDLTTAFQKGAESVSISGKNYSIQSSEYNNGKCILVEAVDPQTHKPSGWNIRLGSGCKPESDFVVPIIAAPPFMMVPPSR